MKELYILRHAQKEIQNDYEYDYDISLSKKGFEDAKKIGKLLKQKEVLPDLIVSSPAIRARQTAQIVAQEIGYDKNIMFNEVIYQAFLNELIESITYTYDSVNSLLIVGHNPALTALALTFGNLKEELQMGNAVKIEFNCNSWIDIDKSNSNFVELIKI
ncbi:SixA phosphatase family protein [Halarcobacter anaerophilus]|jgi:phosphohistidine phosphatase|uniref:Phosphoglycerate mutase n=1 Tax=Halarcobacter anaerophilus TaxID=877500 RepID=A0A4Q0Y1X7_9BACT|nr:histidine phosphatase family protein [Halarcobacter anaerophilus]QDF29716.1 phosphohistidine phosphatase [Halarcobacter anaerophilus]RXJ62639.1 phosphoglycerate mutase [Halarcobacter anaerophilus]